jgi:flavin reductase (DIM6/NTAB) family NADH-FMN oxidoreductase RutF
MKRSLGAQTVAYPAPAFVVATYDNEGKPNMMTAAWSGICCSKPPSIAVALQKPRHTYESIIARSAFTVNIPPEQYVKEVDYVGLYSGKKEDKFKGTGFTAVASGSVDAPYIDEFPLVLECRLTHSLELGMHTQFIGEIVDVIAEEDILDEKGRPDVEKVRPIIFSPSVRQYHGLGTFLGKAFSIGKR